MPARRPDPAGPTRRDVHQDSLARAQLLNPSGGCTTVADLPAAHWHPTTPAGHLRRGAARRGLLQRAALILNPTRANRNLIRPAAPTTAAACAIPHDDLAVARPHQRTPGHGHTAVPGFRQIPFRRNSPCNHTPNTTRKP